jgi:transcriptional regulator with XRE-family HTH domain
MKRADAATPNHLLRNQRILHYWTQSQVAEKVGTTTVNVNRWESGLTSPGLYFRQKLCDLFEKSAEELGLVLVPNELSPSITSPLVFFTSAYADAEKEVVTHVKAALQAKGITLFGSRQVRKQGAENPRKALQEAIRAAQVVLLIISPQARSSHHVQEALQMAKIYKRQICAVWIEGEHWEECIPGDGSELYATIDARGRDDHTLMDEIVAELEPACSVSQDSLEPGEALAESPGRPSEPRNPYKGLKAFRSEDRHDFFGRDRLIAELTAALGAALLPEQNSQQRGRVLAVIGPSGSGKSSVVMAGLIPLLQAGGLPGSQEWVYLEPLVPGTHPIESLALALAELLPDRSLKTILEDLEVDSARGLHLLAAFLAKRPKSKVVLLIDQFEELFTRTTAEEERQRFIDLLVTAVTESSGPVIVILTLRADCYDRPMHYGDLSRLIEAHHRIVLPMEIQELRAAIEQPAQLSDVCVTFEGNLVGDLLFEVQRQPGALPLLQFTLDQLFQRRHDHLLTFEAYREIGGVTGALAQQAEQTYAALPSEEHRRLARALFLRLIDPGATEQDTTRRRAALSELLLFNPKERVIMGEVATAFISARLLTTSTPAGMPAVEVSHEALIREWTRLADWLRAAREDIHLQQAITKDVAAWEQRDKPGDRLYRGSQLTEARKWARRNPPSSREVAFLQASAASRVHSLARILAVLLLLLIMTGVAARLLLLSTPETSAPTTLVTTLNNDGPGSLRQIIAKARPASTITFATGLRGTILLTGTDLYIGQSLTLRGPGADVLALGRGDSSHVIIVLDKANVSISGLTFNSKSIPASDGITNRGTLTLTNCRIAGNGGFFNARSGRLTLIRNMVLGNAFSGIANYGTLTVTGSTIMGNTSNHRGGGITNYGTLTLADSTISGNTAASDGGGIANLNDIATHKGATLTLTNSTISGNTATGNGGGIFNDIESQIILTNSTISGNTATGNGGGISTVGSRAEMTFCTVYGNMATAGGGIWNGESTTARSQVLMRTSLVAGNHAQAGIGPDIAGLLSSDGYNLISQVSGTVFVNPLEKHHTDLSGVRFTDLKMDPLLKENGGPTQTHALFPGSPAIDFIPAEACLVKGISSDQRSMRRPDGQERRCDIGAYEYVDEPA